MRTTGGMRFPQVWVPELQSLGVALPSPDVSRYFREKSYDWGILRRPSSGEGDARTNLDDFCYPRENTRDKNASKSAVTPGLQSLPNSCKHPASQQQEVPFLGVEHVLAEEMENTMAVGCIAE
jgi:hypothetical protein